MTTNVDSRYIIMDKGRAYVIDFDTYDVKVGTKRIGSFRIDTTNIEPSTNAEFIEKDLLHLKIGDEPYVFDMDTNEFYKMLDDTRIRKYGQLVIEEGASSPVIETPAVIETQPEAIPETPIIEPSMSLVFEQKSIEEPEEETSYEEVEILFIEGKKYLHNRDSKRVYNGNTLQFISDFDTFSESMGLSMSSKSESVNKEPKEITRGFINKNNSCYMDSVLFALTYRDSAFLDKHIFKVDPDAISPAGDSLIAKTITKNRDMLVAVKAWLQDPRQKRNASNNPACGEFRKKYKSVRELADGEYEILHDKKWDDTMEDSGEFLKDLFNTFQIRTLRETTKKHGIDGKKSVYEFVSTDKVISPIIVLPYQTKVENFFTRSEITRLEPTNYARRYNFTTIAETPTAETQHRNKYKQFLDKKMGIILNFLETHDKEETILPKDALLVIQKDIQTLNGHPDNYDKTDGYMETIIGKIHESETLGRLFDTYKPFVELKKGHYVDVIKFEDIVHYTPVTPGADDVDNSYLVLNVDRSEMPRNYFKSRKSFDTREQIIGPAGNVLNLYFIVVNFDLHYVTLFKHHTDGIWYVYDDLKRGFERIGTFDKITKKYHTNSTLLFYAK